MNINRPTWIDPRVEVRASSLQGFGSFAVGPIAQGEVVTVWAHSVVSETETAMVSDGETYLRTDGRYVWVPDNAEDLDGYDAAEEQLNHSCDPNVLLADEVTLVARRDIAAGEELTIDYALFELDQDWSGPWRCRCGSPLCRGEFTGRDWQDADLQLRYAGHWHPVIQARIAEFSRDQGP